MLTPERFVDAIVEGLRSAGDAADAAAMRRYMRDQFDFAGVKTPQRRALSQPLIATARRGLTEVERLETAARLWQQPWRECQMVACDLLADRAQSLSAAALPLLDTLIDSKSWWDSVDGLAAQVLGPLVAQHPALLPTLDVWAAGERLWHRRAAILFQLGYGANTDAERLFRYCRGSAGHPDFFIRKAIGWALRQYARTAPDAVRAFLDAEGASLSALSRREAAKHLA
ncbi:DNA alkylation repair protein [Chitinolyticbacter meiyuanensis]|uniref:DNA alkylation repair protein n=1 Tax=Chitinolyticbacter meiyuanensis TaxID=682798 RepID=UPI0011E59384|nr:DNA alkylation repair protein [Chitinolyticbacter meiyuanensis]